MELNYLLSAEDIDTKKVKVLVMRHMRDKPELLRLLMWLASEELELFNILQKNHLPRAEKQLARADYLVSCIGHKPRQALFIGLYKVNGNRPISMDEYWKIPGKTKLQSLGLIPRHDRTSIELFDLELTRKYDEWKGKLIIDWPPPNQGWTRWANQNNFPVKAILEESDLDRGVPHWNELQLTWEELQHLPKSWIGALSQWRGIYFILDGADGKGYVGSAYGNQNLYGRWKNWAAFQGDGGNKRLVGRRPDKFRFSILQPVSLDMELKDIINLESNWKDRLHTREFGLNCN